MKCPHGKKGFCCQCEYGERSHHQSKKGWKTQRDCVDFIEQNRGLIPWYDDYYFEQEEDKF
jgi:hypothetical protein